MNSSIACRYPRFDSGERRLFRTADLLWSRSGRPSFVFGRFSFEDFCLACLLIPAASTAGWPRAYACTQTRRAFYVQVAVPMRLPDAGWPVGTRTGAVFRRSNLAVAPRFLWECLSSQTVNPFPAPATSHPACRFPALGAPVCLVPRVMWLIVLERLSRLTIDGAGSC